MQQEFRESKPEIDSDVTDSSDDSYESVSLDGSYVIELDDAVLIEDGEVVEADSDAEIEPMEEGTTQMPKPKLKTVWSDVVTEQVLSSSMGQLNRKPPVIDTVISYQSKASKKSRKKKSKKNRSEEQSNALIPAALRNYEDFDAENEIHIHRNSTSLNNPTKSPTCIDFNALVKAVEKGRVSKQDSAKKKQQRIRALAPQAVPALSVMPAVRRPNALSRLQIDERVIVNELMTSEELIQALCEALHESNSAEIVRNAVDCLGVSRCVNFFNKTIEKENSGGITVADGSRRKTPGGVFFYLIKTSADVTAEMRSQIFGSSSEQKAVKKLRRRNYAAKKANKRNKRHSQDRSDEKSQDQFQPDLNTEVSNIEMECS